VEIVETIVQAMRSKHLPDFSTLWYTIYIYTTTEFGIRKNQKMACVYHFLVHMQTAKYVAKPAAPPWECFAAYSNSLHIHQEMVYTSHLLIFV